MAAPQHHASTTITADLPTRFLRISAFQPRPCRRSDMAMRSVASPAASDSCSSRQPTSWQPHRQAPARRPPSCFPWRRRPPGPRATGKGSLMLVVTPTQRPGRGGRKAVCAHGHTATPTFGRWGLPTSRSAPHSRRCDLWLSHAGRLYRPFHQLGDCNLSQVENGSGRGGISRSTWASFGHALHRGRLRRLARADRLSLATLSDEIAPGQQ